MCQELVSACMMAHVNTAGIHIPLWLDAAAPAIGWGLSSQLSVPGGDLLREYHRDRQPQQHGQADGDRPGRLLLRRRRLPRRQRRRGGGSTGRRPDYHRPVPQSVWRRRPLQEQPGRHQAVERRQAEQRRHGQGSRRLQHAERQRGPVERRHHGVAQRKLYAGLRLVVPLRRLLSAHPRQPDGGGHGDQSRSNSSRCRPTSRARSSCSRRTAATGPSGWPTRPASVSTRAPARAAPRSPFRPATAGRRNSGPSPRSATATAPS